jgi:hypothetical protein
MVPFSGSLLEQSELKWPLSFWRTQILRNSTSCFLSSCRLPSDLSQMISSRARSILEVLSWLLCRFREYETDMQRPLLDSPWVVGSFVIVDVKFGSGNGMEAWDHGRDYNRCRIHEAFNRPIPCFDQGDLGCTMLRTCRPCHCFPKSR